MLAKLRDTAAQVDERISAGRHKIALQGEASRNATGNYSPKDAPLPDPEPAASGGTQLRVSPVSWTATAAPQTTPGAAVVPAPDVGHHTTNMREHEGEFALLGDSSTEFVPHPQAHAEPEPEPEPGPGSSISSSFSTHSVSEAWAHLSPGHSAANEPRPAENRGISREPIAGQHTTSWRDTEREFALLGESGLISASSSALHCTLPYSAV